LIYLKWGIGAWAFPVRGRKREPGAMMRPWALHSLVWGLTAIGLIAIASMLL
jgi:hypothetical protein